MTPQHQLVNFLDAELSAAQTTALAKHFVEKVVNPCPMCGQREWQVAGRVAALAVDADGTPLDNALITASLVCMNCRFVAHFATKGLLGDDGSDEEGR